MELAKEKGLADDAKKALDEVTSKVAQVHGFDLNAMEELSEDELEAVVGGTIPNWMLCNKWFFFYW